MIAWIHEELGALFLATFLAVRRGGWKALSASILIGGPAWLLLELASRFFPPALLLVPYLAIALYAAPLAAFGIALERSPGLLEVLGRALVRAPRVFLVCLPSGVILLFVAPLLFPVGSALLSSRRLDPASFFLVAGLAVVIALIAFVTWSRYVLFAAAVAVIEPGGTFRVTWQRVEELGRGRWFALAVAALAPVALAVVTYPELGNQLGVFDPGTHVRQGVFGAALVIAFFACAALSAGAYGVSARPELVP